MKIEERRALGEQPWRREPRENRRVTPPHTLPAQLLLSTDSLLSCLMCAGCGCRRLEGRVRDERTRREERGRATSR